MSQKFSALTSSLAPSFKLALLRGRSLHLVVEGPAQLSHWVPSQQVPNVQLCRIDGMAPFEQLSAWLRLRALPHAQCDGSLSSCHQYLTHNASLKPCLWKQNLNSWMGRAVSQLEAPFSLPWSIPNCCDLGSCGLSALTYSCAGARLLICTVAFVQDSGGSVQ